jgi:hypothetical protein
MKQKNKTTTLSTEAIFAGTDEQFQVKVHNIARVSGLTWQHVFSLWRNHAAECQACDQGALLSEFVQWNNSALGGNKAALRAAIGGAS